MAIYVENTDDYGGAEDFNLIKAIFVGTTDAAIVFGADLCGPGLVLTLDAGEAGDTTSHAFLLSQATFWTVLTASYGDVDLA